MRIGELAARGKVTVRTIRYYIEQGLMPEPPHRGKYGEFDESYLQRLRLIQRLKEERLSIPAIRRRLGEMGITTAPPASAASSPLEAGAGEGLFRSRFAEEAGLTSEQVARLEALGLLSSSEGLLPSESLPLARAAALLLARGGTMEDLAEIVQQVRQETALHRRLLGPAGSGDPLADALQWQEQVGAVSTIRQILLQRWGYPGQGETS